MAKCNACVNGWIEKKNWLGSIKEQCGNCGGTGETGRKRSPDESKRGAQALRDQIPAVTDKNRRGADTAKSIKKRNAASNPNPKPSTQKEIAHAALDAADNIFAMPEGKQKEALKKVPEKYRKKTEARLTVLRKERQQRNARAAAKSVAEGGVTKYSFWTGRKKN